MSTSHELTSDGVLVVEYRFTGSPPRLIYKAWREDWHINGWWGPNVKMRFKTGGKLLLTWPEKGVELRGRFVDILENRLIAFTWQWSHDPDAFPFLTTLRFVEEDKGMSTVLRIEQRSFDAQEDESLVAELVEGWKHFLSKLENYAGQMTLV